LKYLKTHTIKKLNIEIIRNPADQLGLPRKTLKSNDSKEIGISFISFIKRIINRGMYELKNIIMSVITYVFMNVLMFAPYTVFKNSDLIVSFIDL